MKYSRLLSDTPYTRNVHLAFFAGAVGSQHLSESQEGAASLEGVGPGLVFARSQGEVPFHSIGPLVR